MIKSAMFLVCAFSYLATNAFSQNYDSDFAHRYAEHLRQGPSKPIVVLRDGKVTPRKPRSYEVYVLEQLFAYFNTYAREFQLRTDRDYSKVSDFRFHATKRYRDQLPEVLQIYVDAWEAAVVDTEMGVVSKGGAVGMKYDFANGSKTEFSIAAAPLSIENVTFYDGSTFLHLDSKRYYRHSTKAQVRHVLRGQDDVNALVVYEPSVLDFGDFRVYAEAYARFTIFREKNKKGLRLREVKVVPKVVYVDYSPEMPESFQSNFSFFTKLEFRFGAQ